MTIDSAFDIIDALAYTSWNKVPGSGDTLRFSFLAAPPSDASADDRLGFVPMNDAQRAATRAALQSWAAMADLVFVEVATGGDLQFGTNNQVADKTAGYAYFPDPAYRPSSAVYLNNQEASSLKLSAGEYGFAVLIHEIGHALGLKHPGNYNGESGEGKPPFLPEELDNTDYTQMSYVDGNATEAMGLYPSTPMLLDIFAIQYVYGPNFKYRAGDDVYKFTDRSTPQAIWDAGGVNTFDFSGCTGDTVIDLHEGEYSATRPGYDNIWIAFGTGIAKAIGGAGNDEIYCGYDGSIVLAGAGSDLIFSGDGDDTIDGGDGADIARYLGDASQFMLVNQGTGWRVVGEGVDYWSGVESFQFDDTITSTASLARLAAPLADASVASGQALSLSLPAGAFTLAGGKPVLAASLASGKALPAWLKFDAASGVFSGTPGSADVGILTVRVKALNVDKVAVGDDFLLTILGGSASAGNDLLTGKAGNELIDGLGGRDTLVLAGARAGYTVSKAGTGFTVRDNVGSGGTDTLAGIERLRFDDTSVALDIAGVGGQTYRLYQAAFNRTPDVGGLGYWMGEGDRGVGLAAVASNFVGSAEFVKAYGPLDNSQFVTQLYANVLHRAPDSAGLAYHVDLLVRGITGRNDTLVSFSESAENQAALIGQMENGFAYTLY
jgi:serralysin